MIFYYLWRLGVLARTDREKIAYFLGWVRDPSYPSHRWPLVKTVNWPRAILRPRYARNLAAWLAYRTELYDGIQG